MIENQPKQKHNIEALSPERPGCKKCKTVNIHYHINGIWNKNTIEFQKIWAEVVVKKRINDWRHLYAKFILWNKNG